MKKALLAIILVIAPFFSAFAQEVDANLVDAVQLYGDGKYKQARQLLGTLAAAAPDNDAVWYYIALTENALQEPEKAEEALEKAVALDSTNVWYRRLLGRIYLLNGKDREGIALYEQYNRDYPSPAELSMIGDYYLAEYSDSLARVRYEEALSLDGTYAPALLGLAEVYRHQRRYDDYFNTLEPFFTSEDIPAQTKGAYIGNLTRGIDPKVLQRHREGFDSLMTLASQTHPADSSILSSVGTYYYATGRQEEAGRWLRAAADIYPESLVQTVTYIRYLGLQKDWEEMRDRSVAAFNRFHELGFLDFANMANYELEDYDAIIGNCQWILTNHPKEKELCLSAWSMMGDAKHAKGDDKGAYKAYDKALKLNPDYVPVLNNYAYYLSLEGKKLKKAYAMSKKTIEAEPDNATYLDTFGWILHLMGKDLEAKAFFKHAMLYGGKESAEVLEHYAVVLEALGEYDTAKVYRNMAKRL